MVLIEDTIVSFDLFEQYFCCNLSACQGACCIEGDAGAPLEEAEQAQIEEVLPQIIDLLPEQNKQVIESQGVSYHDKQGELVVSIVNDRECVFSFVDNDGIRKCALEYAYQKGLTTFYKPISCHLYPVRLEKLSKYTAVNYHRWEVCKSAEILGKQHKLPLYKFLKTPLIRKFGEHWYEELERAAHDYEEAFSNIK